MQFNLTYRSPNFDRTVSPRTVTMVVIHTTEGTFPSDVQYLCNPNIGPKRVSCHVYISRTGQAYLVVDYPNIAWHAGLSDRSKRTNRPDLWAIHGAGNPNAYSIGIEMEARYKQGPNSVQLRTLNSVLVDICRKYPTVLMDRLHIVGHRELNTEKIDPPNTDLDRVVRGISSFLDFRLFPNGHYIRGGFREYYERNGDQALLGSPLTDETNGFQLFEYRRLEYHPEFPGGQQVIRTKLGTLYMREHSL